MGRPWFVETIAPPLLEDCIEDEIRLIAIQDFSARIDRGLN
jgi:hypothetical protein